MKNYIFYLILFTLASCSTINERESSIIRMPTNDSSCENLINNFLQNTSKSELSKTSLLKQGILNTRDFDILENEILKNSLPKSEPEKEKVELSYLLIKKKFPSFEQEQILAHYQILQKYCGI